MKTLLSSPDLLINYARQRIDGVLSGYSGLDKSLLGLKGLVGIVGEPKSCKSTFALNVALHNAASGIPVYYVDRENGHVETTLRALCILTQQPWSALRHHDDAYLRETFAKYEGLPLFYSNGFESHERLYYDIKELVASSTTGKALLILDSLQALVNSNADIRSSIDQLLLFLDEIKLEYENRLTIILTVEKNRQSYGKANLAAAKESGRIEYKVSQLLDFRTYGPDIIVECTANRHGPKGAKIRLRKQYKVLGNEDTFLFTFKEVEDD